MKDADSWPELVAVMRHSSSKHRLAVALCFLVGICLLSGTGISATAYYKSGGNIPGVDSDWYDVRKERNPKKAIGLLLDSTQGFGTFALAGAPRSLKIYGPIFSNSVRLPVQTEYETHMGTFDFQKAYLTRAYDRKAMIETYEETVDETAVGLATIADSLDAQRGDIGVDKFEEGGSFEKGAGEVGWEITETWKEKVVDIGIGNLFRLLHESKPDEFPMEMTLEGFFEKIYEGGLITEEQRLGLIEKSEELGLALKETMGSIVPKLLEYGLGVKVSMQGLLSYAKYLGISDEIFLRKLLMFVQSGEIQISDELLSTIKQSLQTTDMESEVLEADLVADRIVEEGFAPERTDLDIQQKRLEIGLEQHSGIAEPRLTLTKTCDRRAVVLGQSIKFRLVLRNEGNSISDPPMIVDLLPPGTKVVKKSLSRSPVKPNLIKSRGRDCLVWILKKPLPPGKAGYDPITIEYSVELESL